jgi:hypothetical protein
LAAQAVAERIPRGNPRYAWYLEQSQEALVALGLAGAQPATKVTMAPWTGPDLPGSIASTYKYRVVLSGPPGKAVTLHATGLPKHWGRVFLHQSGLLAVYRRERDPGVRRARDRISSCPRR